MGIGLQPDAVGRFQGIMQAARRDYSQEFWWKPGEPTPERAPDVSAVTGNYYNCRKSAVLCSRLRVVLKLRYWYARLIQNLGEH